MPSIMYTYQTPEDEAEDLSYFRNTLNIDVIMNYYMDNVANGAPADNYADVVAFVQDSLDRYEAAGLKGLIRLGPLTQCVAPYGAGEGDAFPYYTQISSLVDYFKNHPALYGWYAFDEPNNGFEALRCENVYDTITAADPAHPVYMVYPGYGAGFYSWVYPYPAAAGRKMYDVFGIDNYQLSNYQDQIAGSYSSVPVADRGRLFNCIQVFGTNAANISSMAAASAAVGWDTEGIAFWLWDWWGTGTTCLKDIPSAHATVASLALQYHENLYAVPPAEVETLPLMVLPALFPSTIAGAFPSATTPALASLPTAGLAPILLAHPVALGVALTEPVITGAISPLSLCGVTALPAITVTGTVVTSSAATESSLLPASLAGDVACDPVLTGPDMPAVDLQASALTGSGSIRSPSGQTMQQYRVDGTPITAYRYVSGAWQ